MDFDFTDEHDQLRDAVARWVDKAYTFDHRRAILREGGFSRQALDEIAGLGLAGLVIDPAHGGLGLGAVEAMVVMEELGRGLVLEPYLHTALVAPALLQGPASQAVDLAAPWLQRMASGESIVVLAWQERRARYRIDAVVTTASQGPDGWALSGTKDIVPAGDRADAFIVPAREMAAEGSPTTGAGDIALFLVERRAEGVTTWGHPMQDGSRAARISFHAARAIRIDTPEGGLQRLERAIDVGIAALAAEAVGVMERALALTVAHLNTRQQFGAPLASFQVLRHRVADMKMQLELARSMSYLATLRLDAPAEIRRMAVAQAKLQLGTSMRFVGQQAIQLHGGIGCTDEMAISHAFKRLTCIESTWGDSLHHLGEVSARMQERGGVFV